MMEKTVPSAASDTLRLITAGRSTGLPHVVELRYIVTEGSFWALGAQRSSDWVQNALKKGEATVRLGRWMYNARVRQATRDEEVGVRRLFAARYGGPIYQRWYAGAAICLRLTPDGPPHIRGISRGEFEATTSYEEWRSRGDDYLAEVSEAFDSASEEYDYSISHNYINSWVRKRSIEEVLRLVGLADTLIEVGCGTGAEAIQLVKHVKVILATDISEAMVELVAKKAQARHLEGRILPFRVRASEIGQVRSLLDGGMARLAYSFNGALNCEPDMAGFVSGLADVLPIGGYFVCSVRNTLCAWEAVSLAGLVKYGRIVSRRRRPIMVSVGGHDIPATYYSPKEFERFFSPRFDLVRKVGLPSVMPPAYLNSYFLKLGPFATFLRETEGRVAGHFPLNWMGDQTLFVFRKVA